MVKKRLIPCLDVDRGRVVKGVRFTQLRDMGDPVKLASRYSRLGADEVIFLDITATVHGRRPMLAVVERAAEQLDVPFTVGGGIASLDHARALMEAGADKITINSAAHDEPSLLSRLRDDYGAQAVVCSIDARRDGEVVTHAGRRPRGIDAVTWARTAVERGAGEILLTSIDADGTRAGYDLALTRAVAASISVPVIASGGAGSVQHIEDAFNAGAEAALVASIVHESPQRLRRLKVELAEAGWPIRN